MISLTLVHLEMYKKRSAASFTLKKSNSKAMLGTPRPLSLKKTRSPTKTPHKLGESWNGQTLKCCKTFLIKGCRGKRRLEGRFKKADHLGNLDDVGGEKIKAPDLNTKRGSIDRTQPGNPPEIPRVVPPSGVPLYNP